MALPPDQALARLREFRNRRPPDLSLTAAIDQQGRDVARLYKAVGSISEAWVRIVPPALAARTELVRLSKGVLTVRVTDASARFELDRFLRSGGEHALARQASTGIRRVRLVL